MTTQERIINYISECNEKTTYNHSKIDTTRLLWDEEYNQKQIYRYLSRYIAVDGEKMRNSIDLFKAIHYCYFAHCYKIVQYIYDFQQIIRDANYLATYIDNTLQGSKPTLDLVIGRFNTSSYMYSEEEMFRLLYDMLEEHYKQLDFGSNPDDIECPTGNCNIKRKEPKFIKNKDYESVWSESGSVIIKGKPIIIGTEGGFPPNPDIFYDPDKEELNMNIVYDLLSDYNVPIEGINKQVDKSYYTINNKDETESCMIKMTSQKNIGIIYMNTPLDNDFHVVFSKKAQFEQWIKALKVTWNIN